MENFVTLKCRRQALGYTKEKLAQAAQLTVAEIECFENGIPMPKYVEQRINDTLWTGLRNMDSIKHYRTKILELALEINVDQDTVSCLKEISHLMVEVGKLQRDILRDVN